MKPDTRHGINREDQSSVSDEDEDEKKDLVLGFVPQSLNTSRARTIKKVKVEKRFV